ncbi:MAG: GMC family oxidoreductase [Bdellovibrionales bacterium]|nr:GMC family oxidoreductase [Bdellovibrionales bacterium]
MGSDGVNLGMVSEKGHLDASELDEGAVLEADVLIIGSGAGGGICAEALAERNIRVVVVEEGPFKKTADFTMREKEAFQDLYFECGGRRTKDKAIGIFQGRAVGGSTTVNWTASFRTPEQTLRYWSNEFGLSGFSAEDLAPWFDRVEKRLNISPWLPAPNENNAIIARGAAALDWSYGTVPRNVRGCADLGLCGQGCPIGAKQSMLVTTIPRAMELGATVISRARAARLLLRQGRVEGAVLEPLDSLGRPKRTIQLEVRAPLVIVAAGGIGSPALLLRSATPDPDRLIGSRTFLHPTVVVTGAMPQQVAGYRGAPQTVYSDHFLWRDGIEGRMGFKIEALAIQPSLFSGLMMRHGAEHQSFMQRINDTQGSIMLLRDGFNEESPGGRVGLDAFDYPELDYTVNDYLWEGVREAYLRASEMLFAAGANNIQLWHFDAPSLTSWTQAKQFIANLQLKPLSTGLFSAHVMGGCSMGADPRRSVVDSRGAHHHVKNLYVIDGSLFPTSLGTNPQLTIYAIAAKLANELAERHWPAPSSFQKRESAMNPISGASL